MSHDHSPLPFLQPGLVYHRPYTLGGVSGPFFFLSINMFVICSTGALLLHGWFASVAIGCEDRMCDEAPAVWDQGRWGWCRDCSHQERRAGRSVAQERHAVTPPHTRQESNVQQQQKPPLDRQITAAVQCSSNFILVDEFHVWQHPRPASKIATSILETLYALAKR